MDMQEKKLYRSRKDKMIQGVCGGIGEFLQVDSTLVRLLMVLFGLFTGGVPSLIFYTVAAIIIPIEPEDYVDIYEE